MFLGGKKHFLPISILFFLWSFSGCRFAASPSVRQVCFQNHCVDVEIADDEQKRIRGLQFRETLGERQGMLFIFPRRDLYPFWMKNTLIALDILWIDDSRRIVDMAKNVPPCGSDPCPSYVPQGKAVYVLEVRGGYIDQNKLRTGDFAQFRF